MTSYTDANGNRLDLIRQVPDWHMTLRITAPDGTHAWVELGGAALEQVAAALTEAAQTRRRPAKPAG